MSFVSNGYQSNYNIYTVDTNNYVFPLIGDGIVSCISGVLQGTSLDSTLTFNDPTLAVNPNLTVTQLNSAGVKLSTSPTNGYIIQGDGSGNMSWVDPSTIAGVTAIVGTANQVLANGTSGSSQTGSVTLTLPQSIATSSTPTFTGLSANSAKITNLANGSVSSDATAYGQLTSGLALKLDLVGGTMSGAIAMGSNKITGLANGSLSGDAVNYSQLTSTVAGYLPLSGGSLSGLLSMGSNKITNLANGTNPGDAVNYSQLTGLSGFIPTIGSSTNNAVALWNGTGGTAIKNSTWVIDSTGQLTASTGSRTYLQTTNSATSATITPICTTAGQSSLELSDGTNNCRLRWWGNFGYAQLSTSGELYQDCSNMYLRPTGSFKIYDNIGASSYTIQLGSNAATAGTVTLNSTNSSTQNINFLSAGSNVGSVAFQHDATASLRSLTLNCTSGAIRTNAASVRPATAYTTDIGTSVLPYNDLYINRILNAGLPITTSASSLVPLTTNTTDIGSSSLVYNNSYVKALNVVNNSTTSTQAIAELCSGSNTSSNLDFSTTLGTFKGRILYFNNVDMMGFHVASQTPATLQLGGTSSSRPECIIGKSYIATTTIPICEIYSSTNTKPALAVYGSYTNVGNRLIQEWYSNNGSFNLVQAQVFADGSFTSRANSYGAISDERLKENLTVCNSQIEDVERLGSLMRKYNFIGNEQKHIGWSAQELRANGFENLINEVDSTEVEDGKLLSVKSNLITIKAVKALSELIVQHKALLARVEQLESTILK